MSDSISSMKFPAPIWSGVAVNRHIVPPNEAINYTAPRYSVDVHLSAPYHLEWKRGSHFERTWMVPDALCVMPAHEALSMRWRDEIHIISVQLDPALMQRAAEELQLCSPVEIPETHGHCDAQISHLCRALWAEAQANYVTGRLFGESLGMALCAYLLQHCGTHVTQGVATGKLSPRAWKRVCEYIEDHLEHSLGLDDLAQVAGLSSYYFVRCFKATSGQSPHQYLIARRVERAWQLLVKTQTTPAQAALLCGFSDQSHLTRHMKQHLGVTPAALRPAKKNRKIIQ